MFDLNEAINLWSENLQRHSILNQAEIDELQDHLICNYQQHLKVAINCIRLFMVAAGLMALLQLSLFSNLDNITPENTTISVPGPVADFLYDHPSLIVLISLTMTACIMASLVASHRVLMGDKVKSLFSIDASEDLIEVLDGSYKRGLIKQPMKTFKWLPY